MCYDISFKSTLKTVQDFFPGLEYDPQLSLEFDNEHVLAQAFRKNPVIIFEDAKYKLKMFEWGIIADYMNTPEKIKQGRNWMCNAQGEKIFGDKRSYWHRIRKQRCLVPVSGFFEHREIKGWKNKVPYFIQVKERALFFLAGLYHYSPIPDIETGELTGTFTIVTREANDLMQKIHNCGSNAHRMPLMLTRELEQKWLLPDLSDDEMKSIVEFEMPSAELEVHPVFTIRSPKPRPDNKAKTEVYEWENLPPL